jgi:hypothetical protein
MRTITLMLLLLLLLKMILKLMMTMMMMTALTAGALWPCPPVIGGAEGRGGCNDKQK